MCPVASAGRLPGLSEDGVASGGKIAKTNTSAAPPWFSLIVKFAFSTVGCR
jgi:hypothetical protein